MTASLPRYVLDSFAILAYARNEPGGPAVRDLLRQAREQQIELTMSVVNYGEVIYRTVRETGRQRAQTLNAEFATYPVQLVDLDRDLALDSALIKGEHPISYADCIAAALAQRLDAAVVTGDPDFHRLEHLVRVEWLPTTTST